MPTTIDKITGGPTEPQFQLLFEKRLAEGKLPCSLLYLNIKHFRSINATYRRQVGDMVLKRIYELFQGQLGEDEFVSRIYTDTFLILLSEGTPEGLFKRTGMLDDAVYFDERLQPLGPIFFSIGEYIITSREDTYDHAIDCANYSRVSSPDKNDENTSFDIYDYSVKDTRARTVELMKKAHAAIGQQGQFQMYLQPKYELEQETVAGAEALIRWIDPEEGMISLGEFMPPFETSGFIRQIDRFIFESVLQFLQRRLDAGLSVVPVSLNLSKMHLTNEKFFSNKFLPIFEKYHVPARYIEFEIPESLMIDDYKRIFRLIDELKGYGFSCSLDDFGSGFSCLNTIKSLPIDVLKLDRKMFSEEDKERGKIVVDGILQIARGLSMQVVAEGVETREFVDFLKAKGCELVQGYYFSKPLPEAEFEALLP